MNKCDGKRNIWSREGKPNELKHTHHQSNVAWEHVATRGTGVI